MARRSRGPSVRPPARTMVWFSDRLNLLAVTAGVSTLVTVLNAAVLALRPFTIVRTWIVIYFDSDQAVATEFGQAVYSEQVVTDSASAVGIASLPTPITETEADYFVYQPLFQEFGFGDATGFK